MAKIVESLTRAEPEYSQRNIQGSVSRGGTDDTPGTPFKKGGLTSL